MSTASKAEEYDGGSIRGYDGGEAGQNRPVPPGGSAPAVTPVPSDKASPRNNLFRGLFLCWGGPRYICRVMPPSSPSVPPSDFFEASLGLTLGGSA